MRSGSCSIDGCSGRIVGRGWCTKHYQRWVIHGDPTAGRDGTPRGAPLQFLTKAIADDGHECVFWPFGKAGRGYGVLPYKGRQIYAHRLVCEMVHGSAPSRLHEVAHGCGNGHLGCVTPRHLRWATRKENHADKAAHGTSSRGERNAMAKLTAEKVTEIRARSVLGGVSKSTLAREFGVSQTTISQIIHRERWGHLAETPLGQAAVARDFGGR